MNIDKRLPISVFVIIASILILLGIAGRKASSKIQAQNKVDLGSEKILGLKDGKCSKIPENLIFSTIGLKVIRKEFTDNENISECKFYISEDGIISLNFETNKNAETQKNSLLLLNDTIASDAAIKMDHFVAMKNDSLVQGVYLVFGPEEYISVSQNIPAQIDKDKFLNLAEKVAQIFNPSE
jgi:hypothetical protein